MTMEYFDDFDSGVGPQRYLRERARIRRALDIESERRRKARCLDDQVAAAAGHIGESTHSDRMVPAETIGVDAAGVALAFAQRVAVIIDELGALLTSPAGRVAAATEARADVAFADVALNALRCIGDAPDGLDCRCEDLRWELNRLEELLRRSGELGDVESWDPLHEGSSAKSRNDLARRSTRDEHLESADGPSAVLGSKGGAAEVDN